MKCKKTRRQLYTFESMQLIENKSDDELRRLNMFGARRAKKLQVIGECIVCTLNSSDAHCAQFANRFVSLVFITWFREYVCLR